jgi:hypothetical protein
MFYFDNQPKQNYGTIRQQIWSALHFPLHIGIVLVVEGAQQVVLAHYVISKVDEFNAKVDEVCKTQALEGVELTNALTNFVDHYAFGEKTETGKS